MSPDYLHNRMTFAGKLYLATAMIVLTAITVLISFFVVQQRQALERAVERQAASLSQSLHEAVRIGMVLDDPLFIEDGVRSLRTVPNVRFALFLDKSGQPLFRQGDMTFPIQLSEQELSEAEQGPVLSQLSVGRSSVPVTLAVTAVRSEGNETVVGYTALGINRSSILQEQQNVLHFTIVAGGTLALLSWLTVYLLIQNLVKPLSAVSEGVRRIENGERGVLVPVFADDDLGKLANHFNNMSRAIVEASDSLTESEKKFRELFESLETPFFILDPAGRFVDYNQALLHMSGMEEVAIGETYCQLLTDGGEPNALMRETFQRPGGVKGYPVDWERPDGSRLNLLLTAKVKRNDAGDPEVIEGMITDISAIRALEAQLIQAQRMESVGTLAGGIAHNFNNLLCSMLICAERVMMNMGQDDPNREWLQRLREAGERGAAVARNLLAFSRQKEHQKGMFSMPSLVAEVVNLLRATFDPRISVQTAVADDVWPILGDQGQIHQVLMNLCVNAKDAIEEGQGDRLGIEVGNADISAAMAEEDPALKPGRYVKLSVRDNGVGISPDVRTRMFDPFFTTKPIGKGTGQGLSSVFGIVASHGGFITVDSVEGSGSAFHVYLPANLESIPSVQPTQPFSPVNTMDKAVGGACEEPLMLLAEDEALLGEMIATHFEANGYQVLRAHDGAEALKLLEEKIGQFSCVLSDAMMPGAGVRELSTWLEQNHPDLPLVVMSGFTRFALEERVGKFRCAAFLSKPISLAQAMVTINDLVRKRMG